MMRKKSKITSWKQDGRRGRKITKRLANVYERRNSKKEAGEWRRLEAKDA